jgi:hypothetical protein
MWPESIIYQPEGDLSPHEITADVLEDEGNALTFSVKSDGEAIGEVDVYLSSVEKGFISGVGPGDKINNGYLRPASLVIAACMQNRDFRFTKLSGRDEAV